MSNVPVGYKQTDVGIIPEDWETDLVKNHCLITTGAKNTQDRIEDGQFPFFVRSQKIEKINSYSFDGEAVLTAGDGVGTGKVFHYIKGKFDLHQRVYKMSDFSEKLDGYFFYLYFSNHFYNRIMQMTAKSSVDSVRMEMIADMKIPLPPTLIEQTAIATALSNVDALLNQLDKLIAKKRDIKQATMQQLLTGKKRLAGFSGEWEVKKLGDVCWYQEGPGLRQWQFTKRGMKVINVTNLENGILNLDRTDRHISMNEFSKMYQHFAVDPDDIVMASSGNSYGKAAIVRKQDLPLVMNTSVIRFKPLKNLNYHFLWIFLNSDSFKEQIDLMITGGAQPNFGPFHLNKIELCIPSIEEQTAIATLLTDMDNEISQLQQRRHKTHALKQGMMQQLLTGKIRLVAQ